VSPVVADVPVRRCGQFRRCHRSPFVAGAPVGSITWARAPAYVPIKGKTGILRVNVLLCNF
jgi:hypothetical protein